jgi:hypothetical protein
VGIWLEDKIREAILALRFKRAGDGIDPGYFVDAPPEPFHFEASAAAFLAHFIAKSVINGKDEHRHEGLNEELDQYSLEVIASYLEDQGYVVSSPD